MTSQPHPKNGRVIFVGTGLKAIAHMTQEAVAEIKAADIVFYHATDGVTAKYLTSLNANTHDLYRYYGNGKPRNTTYLQMSEVILGALREGKFVVGVFYGHPGVFVKPIRRVIAMARAEGYEASMQPGITSLDALFADLHVDPSRNGCQILEASDMFIRERKLNTDGQVIILQIGAFGDSTFSFKGYKKLKLNLFIEYLIDAYAPDAPCTIYRASNFPGVDAEHKSFQLKDLLDRPTQEQWIKGVSTLYIPPLRLKAASADRVTQLGYGKAGSKVAMTPTSWETDYTPAMKKKLAGLDKHQDPEGYIKREASPALHGAVKDLVFDPDAKREFQNAPDVFLAKRPELTPLESQALKSKKISRITHAAKQDLGAKNDTVGNDVNAFLNTLINTGHANKLTETYMAAARQPGANGYKTDAAVNQYILSCGRTDVYCPDIVEASNSLSAHASFLDFVGTYQLFGGDTDTEPDFLFYISSDSNGKLVFKIASQTFKLTDATDYLEQVGPSKFLLNKGDGAIGIEGIVTVEQVDAKNNSYNIGAPDSDRINLPIHKLSAMIMSTAKGSDGYWNCEGLRNGFSKDALAATATTPYDFWIGDYHVAIDGSETHEITVSNVKLSEPGLSAPGITIDGHPAQHVAYDSASNMFSFLDSTGNSYQLFFSKYYFDVYADGDAGVQVSGYRWGANEPQPSSPNAFGATSAPPAPSPERTSDAERAFIAFAVTTGVKLIALFVRLRAMYAAAEKVTAAVAQEEATAAQLALRYFARTPLSERILNSSTAPYSDQGHDGHQGDDDMDDNDDDNDEDDADDADDADLVDIDLA